MVEAKNDAVLKLPADMKDRLTRLSSDIRKARHGIEVLKSMGMGTADIEDKLKWAESVRETLLREFS